MPFGFKFPVPRWLQLLGPGLVTGAADDDPSGVATYSQTGAAFGYSLLWTVALTTPLMLAAQLTSARIGRITGAGVVANVRRHLPHGVAQSLVILLVLANITNIAADLAAMGETLELLVGGSEHSFVLLVGASSAAAQVLVPYRRYAPFLRWSSLALFAYVGAAFAVTVDWRAALRGALLPSGDWSREALMMIVAALGTTISPYLFVWQAAQEIEEMRLARHRPLRETPGGGEELARLRIDTGIGVVLSNLVGFFIILSAAATLHVRGVTDIKSAAEAAGALRPLAGELAFGLFALGIVGTGLLAIPVLAGSAAYAVSEAFGAEFSLEKPFRGAPGLYSILIIATLGGMAMDFSPVPPMKLLIFTAVLNGLIAPPFLAAMMLIVSNSKAMGAHVAPSWLAVLGWMAALVMGAAAAMLVISLV